MALVKYPAPGLPYLVLFLAVWFLPKAWASCTVLPWTKAVELLAEEGTDAADVGYRASNVLLQLPSDNVAFCLSHHGLGSALRQSTKQVMIRGTYDTSTPSNGLPMLDAEFGVAQLSVGRGEQLGVS